MTIPAEETARPQRSKERVFRLLGSVFGLLGGVMLLAALVTWQVQRAKYGTYMPADGLVVQMRSGGRSLRPVVEFSPTPGGSVRFESSLGSRPPAYAVGDRVPVLFPPADPTSAVIDRYWELWFFPTLIAMIGTPFFLLGMGFHLASRRE